ncbi:MAG: hypothetical protein MJZ73_00760 [Bacteroidaceae bacterium]|nr:hypothetical protein [Bacteroidaceae bacterium]
MRQNWTLEDNIKKDCFKVPEGYFETLTSRVMSNLPEKKDTTIKPWSKKYHAFFYAAAVFIGIIICSASLYHFSSSTGMSDMALEDSIYMDEMVDYTMMDYLTIHQYLTDASGE